MPGFMANSSTTGLIPLRCIAPLPEWRERLINFNGKWMGLVHYFDVSSQVFQCWLTGENIFQVECILDACQAYLREIGTTTGAYRSCNGLALSLQHHGYLC